MDVSKCPVVVKELIKIKAEAIKMIKELVHPGVLERDEDTAEEALAAGIYLQPIDDSKWLSDWDEDELILSMDLAVYVSKMPIANLETLTRVGEVTIMDIEDKHCARIVFRTSYNIEAGGRVELASWG